MELKKLLAGSAFFIAAGALHATPVDLADLENDSGDQAFADVPEDTYFDTGAALAQLTDVDNNQDDANFTLLLKAADTESQDGFGIYGKDSKDMLEVFNGEHAALTGTTVAFDLSAGTATNQTTGTTADIGSMFGFYLEKGDKTIYSDPDMNEDGDQALIYDTTGTSQEGLFGSDLVVAMEGGDNADYNDFVAGVTDVSAVPEPSTLALFGLGLVGAGVAQRRKAS
ncbi:PEP-CTERM sorting domain-containing protein [Marinobacteraceae bacterium S3BR75-40.1]